MYRTSAIASLIIHVLAFSAVMANEPKGAFSGRVTDALSGNPIEGALVWIDEKGSRTPMNRDSVFTDATGAYSFSDLAPIEEKGFGYLLGVKMAGYRPAMPTVPINLGPGEAKTLDFALQPPLSLHVRVVDADVPSAGLSEAGMVATLSGDGSPFIDQKSDSSGWFHLQDAPRTTLELTLTKAGYKTRLVREMVEGLRREDTLIIELRRDEPATGRTVSGIVKDSQGLPAEVRLYFSCPAEGGTAWFIAYSGKDGAYAIPGIPAECDSGTFHFSGIKEVTVALTSSETRMDLVYVSPVLGVRKLRPVGRMLSPPRLFRARDVLGRVRLPATRSGN